MLCSSAYQVLLGRPFDVITQSVVKNMSKKHQTLAIKDLNSGMMVTIPTIERGKGKRQIVPEEIIFWKAPWQEVGL
jgi:hypothetical protein